MTSVLQREAEALGQRLAQAGKRIVLAESCTAGLASASLAAVPGISQWHCGSAVTYRQQTKIDWLGISPAVIEQAGVVSDVVARAMATGVLARTREADLAAAVTGHLGPAAPADLDGVLYVAVAERTDEGTMHATAWRHTLQSVARLDRQVEAATLLIQRAIRWLATD